MHGPTRWSTIIGNGGPLCASVPLRTRASPQRAARLLRSFGRRFAHPPAFSTLAYLKSSQAHSGPNRPLTSRASPSAGTSATETRAIKSRLPTPTARTRASAFPGASSSARRNATSSDPGEAQQQKSHFQRLNKTCRYARQSPRRRAQNWPAQIRQRILRHGNHGIQPAEKMKSVVRQPHAKSERRQRIRVAHRQRNERARVAAPHFCEPRRQLPATLPARPPEKTQISAPSTGASAFTCSKPLTQFSTA